VYGYKPIKSAAGAFGRGFASGAVTSVMDDAHDMSGIGDAGRRRTAAGSSIAATGALAIARNASRSKDPRSMCGSGDAFSGGIGSQRSRGYQQERSERGSGFSLGSMLTNALIGGLVGGFTSTAFYGIDKAVGAVSESIARNRRGRQQRIRENKSSKYQKASLWERLTKRKARVDELYANPLDEFSNPKIGPCESAVSRYIKQINQTGKVANPIEVQKLTSVLYR